MYGDLLLTNHASIHFFGSSFFVCYENVRSVSQNPRLQKICLYLLSPSFPWDQAPTGKAPKPCAMSALHQVALLALLVILNAAGALPSAHDIRKQTVTEDAYKHVERRVLGADDNTYYVPTRACDQCDRCVDKGSVVCKFLCRKCPQNVTMVAGGSIKFQVRGDTLATLNSSQGLTVSGKK